MGTDYSKPSSRAMDAAIVLRNRADHDLSDSQVAGEIEREMDPEIRAATRAWGVLYQHGLVDLHVENDAPGVNTDAVLREMAEAMREARRA